MKNFFDDFEKYGDKEVAVSDDGSRLTYNGLGDISRNIGNVVAKRSLVFCFCSNTIGSLAGYISFLKNRIVPLMLDANINDELANNLIEVYKPAYLYMPLELADKYQQEMASEKIEKLYENFGYVLLKTDFEKSYPLYEELGLLLTTSGSTGSPKLVRQSYTNIQSNAKAIVQYLEIDENERPVTTLPMNYTYGLSIVNSHVYVGATILLTKETIVSRNFWTFVKEQKASSFGGVPFTYEMLKKIRFFKMDLPNLKYFTQAGGKLSPELHKEFAEYANAAGKKFVVMYGQTEATARMAYLPAEDAIRKYGSMGIPIPGGKFTLTDVNGNAIEEAEITGELVYEGDNVTLGYATSGEDLIKGDERGGILETGDMAKRDAEGYYYVVGRKKRFLKLFGNRINLDEIDRIVSTRFDELDCASTGSDELMKVYITNEDYIEKVEKTIEELTHINKRAFKVEVIDEIPRNESGKVLYKDLP
jgi:acyl-coenzyme A synthetase/AMP-(fatty) acid ligase